MMNSTAMLVALRPKMTRIMRSGMKGILATRFGNACRALIPLLALVRCITVVIMKTKSSAMRTALAKE